MRAPVAVLYESFLSDAFAGREGQAPPFKGRAYAAPALCKTTLICILGACHSSFFVFVSDRSKSGFTENRIQICFS